MQYINSFTGEGNITARLVAYSVSAKNPAKKIMTFELEYMRFIHAEFMTHRLFSRNAASSRAIPVKTMLELIRNMPAAPIHWGKNQAGMQAKEECDNIVELYQYYAGQWVDELDRKDAWKYAANSAAMMAEAFEAAGYHKQIVNRLLEPFQMIKVVMTTTEIDNFFWLRNHPDAQPEINELARCMMECLKNATPEALHPGEWHTPYVMHFDRPDGEPGIAYAIWENGVEKYITLEEALKVSSSCCGQVSYRKNDDSLEKAIGMYTRLVESEPVHASPFEHQATPMVISNCQDGSYDMTMWDEGITHMDRKGDLWSGNFCGFIQHRQLIPNNACWKYEV